MLDFDTSEATMFLLNLPQSVTGGQKAMISMWARPELNSITVEQNTIEAYGSGWGNPKVATLTTSQTMAFEISLHPCVKPEDKNLYILKIDN